MKSFEHTKYLLKSSPQLCVESWTGPLPLLSLFPTKWLLLRLKVGRIMYRKRNRHFDFSLSLSPLWRQSRRRRRRRRNLAISRDRVAFAFLGEKNLSTRFRRP